EQYQIEIGAVVAQRVQRGVAVASRGRLEPLVREQAGQRAADALLVVDDQDAGHLVTSLAFGSLRALASRALADTSVAPRTPTSLAFGSLRALASRALADSSVAPRTPTSLAFGSLRAAPSAPLAARSLVGSSMMKRVPRGSASCT